MSKSKNKKIKVGLFGGDGKMGQAIVQTFSNFNELVPFLFVGKTPCEIFNFSVQNLKNIEQEILSDVDVWIEFSSPEGLEELIKATENHKTPIVSGTTGLAEKDFVALKKQSAKRGIFWASNMSPGLWAFRQALKNFKHIANFDFGLDEIHHIHKKDKPSGTAKTLHKDLESAVGKKIETPTSYRLGGVFGIHNVYAASANEVITMQHQALNRNVFAEGALKAAAMLANKKSGFYDMDALFLNNK